jgi:H+/gluconate symporter-like permease
MLIEGRLDKLNVRSPLLKLIIGSAFVALAVALGTVVILSLLGFAINPAIPAVLAAVAAAAFAVRMRESAKKREAEGDRPGGQDR